MNSNTYSFSCVLLLQLHLLAFSTCRPSSESISNLIACLTNAGTHPSVYISKDNDPSNYDKLNYQQNELYGDIEPLGIIVVENVADVSNAVRCAKEHNIRIVAKSGGHSFEKYSYGDSNSIVIDLRKLDTISVDKNSRTAEVGAGVLWAHFHWKLWNSGKLGFPSGVCVQLGSGTTLGGGHGILSKRFGLAADNVLETELVDSNGNIQIVNHENNPDLFWALRGAGKGNFGIVTKFKYKVFDLSEQYTHIHLIFRVYEFPNVLHAWDSWNAKNQGGTIYTLLTAAPTFISVEIIDSGLTNDTIAQIVEYFEGQALPPTITTGDYIDIITNNPDSGYSLKRLTKGSELEDVEREDSRSPRYFIRVKSYFASKTISMSGIEMLAKMWKIVPNVVNIKISSIGGFVNTVNPNATAFVHRNALYYLQMGVTGDSEATNKWVKEFDEIIRRVLDNGESFQNSMDGQLENYLVRYYGANLPRLVKIKKMVDPDNLFNYAQSIPLKL